MRGLTAAAAAGAGRFLRRARCRGRRGRRRRRGAREPGSETDGGRPRGRPASSLRIHLGTSSTSSEGRCGPTSGRRLRSICGRGRVKARGEDTTIESSAVRRANASAKRKALGVESANDGSRFANGGRATDANARADSRRNRSDVGEREKHGGRPAHGRAWRGVECWWARGVEHQKGDADWRQTPSELPATPNQCRLTCRTRRTRA